MILLQGEPLHPWGLHSHMLLHLHIYMCRIESWEQDMPTNLAIDDRLIQEAQKLGRHRTKKEAVTAALDEYVRRRRQQDILALFGTMDYEKGFDYKKERRAKRK